MPITPCDDPNCTCGDPELRLFTEQVLRKDATKTDYIVIPLVGGVLARCILSDDSDGSTDPEGIAQLMASFAILSRYPLSPDRRREECTGWRPTVKARTR